MVPLKMETVAGVKVLKDKGIKPQIIYIDADHHYAPCKADIQACLRAFPDAILVGDDYGHYESVRNAVTECALEFDKHVHVDQNHCWTYHRMESGTGRTFKPKPKATDSFASLLAGLLCYFLHPYLQLPTPSPRRSHRQEKLTTAAASACPARAAACRPCRTKLPLLQPVQPRLLLLDHQEVLRSSLLSVGLAAGVRLELELFSVQDLACLPLFDRGSSLHGFGDDVGT